MNLKIHSMVLGPMSNNVYFITDLQTNDTIIIDPTYQSNIAYDKAKENNFHISQIWITHAHFDHIAGVDQLISLLDPPVKIGLHTDDLTLWQSGGGARDMGFFFEVNTQPTFFFHDKEKISFGGSEIEVRQTPGHTNGHVVFYIPDLKTGICGDLIFQGGVGRTDFPYGDHATLIKSIKNEILTLPPETKLLSGHGPETTVAKEIANNPFLI